MSDLEALRERIVEATAAATSPDMLEIVRVEALGKKGTVTGLLKELGRIPAEERRERGQAINALKEEVSAAIDIQRVERKGRNALIGVVTTRKDIR